MRRALPSLLLLAVAFALPAASAAPKPRFAVLVAFGPELARLKGELRAAESVAVAGRTFYSGSLRGRDVILVLSGEGMVNAALTAQAAIDRFPVRALVVSGIAGGVDPELRIGDVVVPERWSEYQFQLFAQENDGRWESGPFSFDRELGNFGMMFPKRVPVPLKDGTGDEELRWLPVSERLLESAKAVSVPGLRVLVGGSGVSGDALVYNAAYREYVWKTFRARALDMESAAVAHVAYQNGVPFIAFRSLSDLAGGQAGGKELRAFFQSAADNAAAVVAAFIEKTPE